MKSMTIFIHQAAQGFAPSDWQKNSIPNIHRLYYIIGGKGRMIDEDGQVTRFEAGKIYLLPCNMSYSLESDPERPIEHIYFDFISIPPIVSKSPIIYDVEPGSALAGIVSTAAALLPKRSTDRIVRPDRIPLDYGQIPDAVSGSSDELCQLIYSLFDTLLRLLQRERELPFLTDSVINESLELIKHSYSSRISVAEIAANAGFEVNHFIRRFKRVMGITPYAYLRNYRLLKARALISQGLTIAEAAERVGYENASSLSRAFRIKS